MLQFTPEAARILHADAARREERARQKRMRKKSLRRLDYHRHRRLVDGVADVLRTGEPTRFEFEGACRHGVRVSLIFEKWSWKEANDCAEAIVNEALLQIGAFRPRYDEGQPEYVENFRHERFFCVRCGSKIDGERKRNGTPAKYCSDLCGMAARQAKARVSEERVSLAEHLARQALKTEKRIKERTAPCENCSRPFIRKRPETRFCCRKCRVDGTPRKRADIPCKNCGTLFRPATDLTVFCSKKCTDEGHRKKRPTIRCETCGTLFSKNRSGPLPRFCSRACNRPGKRREPTIVCEPGT